MEEEREEPIEECVGLLLGNVVPAVGQDDAVEPLGHRVEEGAEPFVLSVGSGDAEDRHGERVPLAPVVLSDVLRWNADVRVEPGPQTLAAPSEFGRQVVDPDETPADGDPVPRPGHRRVHRRPRLESAREQRVREGEAVLPRGDFAQLLADP
ncbi:hypothetical protein G9272_42620 [Streptomyces asoensis]|uniref:Uncharacterized protein n=1 Tax=Streptomyces asoensis TaxID=249586 RepID=A0A6M4X065_9ACTN|nr:hypothetical protein G9272_42620 [Streptomyces asoensis]